ncbi:hypothetical protein DL767_010253 [Monosporascus sp. MG133]|nr:hypothetical protein DL767_010253 [Monosporascus sp. MG133]
MQKPCAREGKEMEYKRFELGPIPELEADGWTIWEYPAPATDPANEIKDPRNADRMRDVESTDAPDKDTRVRIRPTVPDDADIQAQASISSAPFRRPPEWSDAELNSATSGGHAQIYERPPGVGLGWGDYDLFGEWQAHGREVTPDMVEDKPWNLSLAEFDFVTEGDPSDVIHVSGKLRGEEVGFEDPPKPLREKLMERKMKDGQPEGGSSRGGTGEGARGGARGGGRGGSRGGSHPALTGNDFW